MEYLKLIVELAKATAWPLATFAVGCLFRSEVRTLFPRLTKAGPAGLEFSLAQQSLVVSTELPGFPKPTRAIAAMEETVRISPQPFEIDTMADAPALAQAGPADCGTHRPPALVSRSL
jgi:hypothetical protein